MRRTVPDAAKTCGACTFFPSLRENLMGKGRKPRWDVAPNLLRCVARRGFFRVFFSQDFDCDMSSGFEGSGFDDVTERVGDAAFASDDATDVVGVNAHAVNRAGLVVELFDFDILRARHDALHKIANEFNEAVFGACGSGRPCR